MDACDVDHDPVGVEVPSDVGDVSAGSRIAVGGRLPALASYAAGDAPPAVILADIKDGVGCEQPRGSRSGLRAADHHQVPAWQFLAAGRNLEPGGRQPVAAEQAYRPLSSLGIFCRDQGALPVSDPVAERDADADRPDAEERSFPCGRAPANLGDPPLGHAHRLGDLREAHPQVAMRGVDRLPAEPRQFRRTLLIDRQQFRSAPPAGQRIGFAPHLIKRVALATHHSKFRPLDTFRG